MISESNGLHLGQLELRGPNLNARHTFQILILQNFHLPLKYLNYVVLIYHTNSQENTLKLTESDKEFKRYENFHNALWMMQLCSEIKNPTTITINSQCLQISCITTRDKAGFCLGLVQ